jgi:ketosteroid isomerase-like protein
MKIIRLPLALLSMGLLVMACTNNGAQPNAENIAVVERYIKAVEAKDLEAMKELLADNYVGYGPSFTDSTNKDDALANFKEISENLYEKIDYKRTVNITAKITEGPNPGDYVSDWAILKITYKDGRGPVTLTMNAVYRIENGKINLSRSFYNEADVLRQLGYDYYAAE